MVKIIPAAGDVPACVIVPVGTSFADAKRAIFLATMEHHKGKQKAVVATLGISAKTVYNWAKEFERQPEPA